jgi:Ca-activated chloride channel family protein
MRKIENLASIGGIVKDARTKAPLKEAVITISSDVFKGQKYALTDTTGVYRITNLPPGNYVITFEMEGYKNSHRKVFL